jgi:nitroreductase
LTHADPPKTAATRFPIEALLAERWSPRAFQQRAVEQEKLGSLLEAARLAPSCFNDQPWSFFVATRDERERFERLASCLVETNRAWAEKAPVLMLSVARKTFRQNGKPNRHAGHDVGLAVGGMLVQAQALGLSVHQMAGFDAQRARELLGIPDDHEPMAMTAVGYRGEPDALPDKLRERELAPRERRPLAEIAFGARFGEPLEWLDEAPGKAG